jgi:hypothetical protein
MQRRKMGGAIPPLPYIFRGVIFNEAQGEILKP